MTEADCDGIKWSEQMLPLLFTTVLKKNCNQEVFHLLFVHDNLPQT